MGTHTFASRSRAWPLACSAGLAAFALGAAPVVAGPAPSGMLEGGDEGLQADGSTDTAKVVVTGSRIRADGMQAPVPVTVFAAEEIQSLSPGALITGVTQLLQFYGNQMPDSGISSCMQATARSTCTDLWSFAR